MTPRRIDPGDGDPERLTFGAGGRRQHRPEDETRDAPLFQPAADTTDAAPDPTPTLVQRVQAAVVRGLMASAADLPFDRLCAIVDAEQRGARALGAEPSPAAIAEARRLATDDPIIAPHITTEGARYWEGQR